MNEKGLSLFSGLLLAALVGIMSWQSMHPQKNLRLGSVMAGYFANTETTSASLIPDDSLPVTIAQGTFRYTPDRKTKFQRQGMAPALFAQRQVNALLRFENLPPNPDKTFPEIDKLLQDWKAQGASLTAIFLDYRPAHPDFNAYAAFIRAFKKHFLADPHLLIPVIDTSWLGGRKKQGVRLLQPEVPFFLIELPTQAIPPATLQDLKSFEYSFQLKLPAGPSRIDQASLQAISLFGGCIYTVDTLHPILKKEKTIGIFPKL